MFLVPDREQGFEFRGVLFHNEHFNVKNWCKVFNRYLLQHYCKLKATAEVHIVSGSVEILYDQRLVVRSFTVVLGFTLVVSHWCYTTVAFKGDALFYT